MGPRFLIDTNVVIDHLDGLLPLPSATWYRNAGNAGQFAMSVITRIELLSKPLVEVVLQRVMATISTMDVLPLGRTCHSRNHSPAAASQKEAPRRHHRRYGAGTRSHHRHTQRGRLRQHRRLAGAEPARPHHPAAALTARLSLTHQLPHPHVFPPPTRDDHRSSERD